MSADSRQIERIAADWLAQRDGDGWTAADEARLSAWLSVATAHRVAFLRLEAAWEESGRLKALAAGRDAAGPPERSFWPAPPAVDIIMDTARDRLERARPAARRPAARPPRPRTRVW
ncbi:MAG: FecR/PupR family sigma factor regulator, partial [Lysobacteraceae bacterium]